MDTNTPTDLDRGVKAEEESGDTRMVDDKPTYRSWKKKYRKMRIVFDRKMHEGEDLHRHEQKALATARRLAIEKDQLLDLLLDVNNSLQIPPEKRFDLSLDPSADRGSLNLEIDNLEAKSTVVTLGKSYKQLLTDIPHSKYATAAERFPELFADLEAGRDSPADPSQGQSHPPSFLTADDIDDYIWEIDNRTASDAAALLPTLAPAAQANGGTANGKDAVITIASASRDFALRNPTSVYNWLRKHAPKTFLQDGEGHAAGGDKENGDDHVTSARGNGRAAKGERGTGGSRASGAARSKRASAAHSRDKHPTGPENTEYVDDENGYDVETPNTMGGKGKRKRMVDDDPGYRPKGGSSRPAKKKRKSEGVEATERASSTGPKKSRKSAGSVDTAMRDVED
ncbi:hypothetical protein GQ53DRAFT_783989 [Thozetella sp. PMI_491]|nr:hypothetical protein GQ53DRAFT_783989 [Thozetella sp. PMI_491]